MVVFPLLSVVLASFHFFPWNVVSFVCMYQFNMASEFISFPVKLRSRHEPSGRGKKVHKKAMPTAVYIIFKMGHIIQ